MKVLLAKTAQKMSQWPYIGYIVRLSLAIIRLPQLHTDFAELVHRQQASDKDLNNLVISVPISLRNLTREVNKNRSQQQSEFSPLKNNIPHQKKDHDHDKQG